MKKLALVLFAMSCVNSAYGAPAIPGPDKLAANEIAESGRFDCVGRMVKDSERYSSCILIDKKYALATANSFLYALNKTNQIPSYDVTDNLKQIRLIFGKDTVRIKKFTIHPNYSNSYYSNPDVYGQYNVVLLELEKPVNGIAPATLCNTKNERERKSINVQLERKIKLNGDELIDSVYRTGKIEDISALVGGINKGNETLLLVYTESPDYLKMHPMSEEQAELERRFNLRIPVGLFTEKNGNWELSGLLTMTKYSFITEPLKQGQEPPKDETRFVRISSVADWIKQQIK